MSPLVPTGLVAIAAHANPFAAVVQDGCLRLAVPVATGLGGSWVTQLLDWFDNEVRLPT